MKNIIKLLVPAMALLFAATSCTDSKDKYEVEDAWGTRVAPNVTLNSAAATSYATAEVSAEVSAQEYAEVGVALADNAEMTNPTYQPAAIAEGATSFVATATKLTPKTTYYVAAYVINKYGQRALSAAKQITTPDKELTIDMVTGTFASAVYLDYWGDKTQITNLIVEEDPNNTNGIIVKNIDPYFASNGLTADKGYNIFEGEVNLSEKTMTVYAGQKIGYQEVVLMGWNAASPNDADDYDDVHISIKDYGETLVIENAFGTYSNGWWSLQNAPITLSKK